MAAPTNKLFGNQKHPGITVSFCDHEDDNDSTRSAPPHLERVTLDDAGRSPTDDRPSSAPGTKSSETQRMWQDIYKVAYSTQGTAGPSTEVQHLPSAVQDSSSLQHYCAGPSAPPQSAPPNRWTTEQNAGGQDRFSSAPPVSVTDIALMVQPFTGVANVEQSADKWLLSFNTYTTFKNIHGQTKINLFKLMLTDQAAAWLMALPTHTTHSWDSLVAAFRQRYGITEAEKWRYQKDIWSREQRENETVDDYVTAMQLTANKIGIPQETLREAIIQGLKPELRLFVLNANAHDIPTLLAVARTCEAARSADRPRNQDSLEIKSMFASLMQQLQQMATSINAGDKNEKRVSFVQSALDDSQNMYKNDVDTR